MLAMFKKELRSYFRSMTGYVFVALFLLVLGYFTNYYCFVGLSPHFEYIYYSCSFVFLIAVPVLTMRSFADERRQKTDQLLYSLPISTTQIVLGKYFAMLCVFLLPILVTCLYPLLLHFFDPSGYISYAAIYASVFAFFCMGAALIAIGMFMSSLTENVFISAIVCFVALLFCYLMGVFADQMPTAAGWTAVIFALMILLIGLLVYFMTRNRTFSWVMLFLLELPLAVICFVKPALLEGLLPKVFGVLSIFDRFYSFAEGLSDLKAILYFVSIAVLFTLFTVQSMEKRRWS